MAVALVSAFLFGKNFQKNQMPIEKVDNKNSVAEFTTEHPTATVTEIETTVVNAHLPDYVANKKSKKIHFCLTAIQVQWQKKINFITVAVWKN